MIDLTSKRVLVTGGGGFLGQFICEKLKQRGCSALVPRRSLPSNFPPHRKYNLIDGRAVKHVYADAKPDVVIHLAAVVGGIGANRAHPGKFFYENIMMGVQLMEEARKSGVQKFVALGTICAYPKFTPVPFKESDLWSGYPEETNAPYGLAKKMLLVQSQSYRQEYGFNSIFLLPVNLYGPGDNFNPETSHVIPALIRKCVEAKNKGFESIAAWGTGAATREFLYVEDAAEAVVLAAEKYDKAEPINVGNGMEITIKALTHLICEIVGYTGAIEWDGSKPDGQPRRCLDVTMAEREFGFKANVNLVDGLKRTIEWYLGRGALR